MASFFIPSLAIPSLAIESLAMPSFFISSAAKAPIAMHEIKRAASFVDSFFMRLLQNLKSTKCADIDGFDFSTSTKPVVTLIFPVATRI